VLLCCRESIKTLGANINAAVKDCRTDYFVRVDGDDWDRWTGMVKFKFYDDSLAMINSQYFYAYCPLYVVFRNGNENILRHSPQGAGIIYRIDYFNKLGGYDETLNYQSDLDFYIRFTRRYHMGYSMVRYRWYITDKSQSIDSARLLDARYELLEKYQLRDQDIPHFGAYNLGG